MSWLITLVVVAVFALAVIGLGPVKFFGGVYAGFQTILQNPAIAAALSQLQNFAVQQLSNAVHF